MAARVAIPLLLKDRPELGFKALKTTKTSHMIQISDFYLQKSIFKCNPHFSNGYEMLESSQGQNPGPGRFFG
jgi:hypothetical protein